ncbi:hypothetical protein NP493_830g01025 [Ridgeia piscesae]|uniref:Uncharacterized protein n=1 Tax=Ridgeia piscesae TaxID=27915 RepID=A0AAD9NNY9_RIDPI|nr:hypothetical protein NP493_830g01025 [Ridgeia piscesae]
MEKFSHGVTRDCEFYALLHWKSLKVPRWKSYKYWHTIVELDWFRSSVRELESRTCVHQQAMWAEGGYGLQETVKTFVDVP